MLDLSFNFKQNLKECFHFFYLRLDTKHTCIVKESFDHCTAQQSTQRNIKESKWPMDEY